MTVLESFSLNGKVAVVTGASRGIGRALAQALGEAGAAVAVTARTLAPAQRAADELRAAGITALPVGLEATDPAQVDLMVRRVTEELDPIDVLVNNAGI